jgi:spermidine synthase
MAKPADSSRSARRRTQLAERRVERRERAAPKGISTALGVAFLLSGAAGLVHEVVWVRLLGFVFGVTELAIATVLAAFMGGLALGSWVVGTRSERFADRRRAYAWLEIAIGLSALVLPLLLTVVQPLYAALWRRFHLSFASFSVLRFLVAGTLLLGPTALMGATFPVLADHLARAEGRRVAPSWLYTMNLLGAVLGVALAGFVLMPSVGITGTILVGALLNVGVGVWVLLLPSSPEHPMPSAPTPAADGARPGSLLFLAAFASGALALITQIAWTRVLTLVVGSTTYAFSAVLLVYLVALGAGSALATRRSARGTIGADLGAAHLVTALGLLLAVFCVNSLPYWYMGLYDWFGPQSSGGSVARAIVTTAIVLAVPVVAAGTILPLALAAVVPRDGIGTGPAVGRLYALNTLGAILGSILAGFVLVPRVGTQTSILGVAGVATVIGLAFVLTVPGPRWLRPAGLAAAAVVATGIAFRPAWNFHDLHAGVAEPGRFAELGKSGEVAPATGRGAPSPPASPEPTPPSAAEPAAPAPTGRDAERLLYQREGPTATVAIVQLENGDKTLVINARTNASDGIIDMGTQMLLAHIPLLLSPRTDDVFIVGWGSGVTVGAATQTPAKHITAVELEPAVVEASHFFDHANHAPLNDPRVRLYEDDARHILLASEDTYDVIISEPPHPWVSGVANLFTRDFYRIARRRLREGGVFTQWLQTYQITLDTYRSILATFQDSFPEVLIFHPPGGADTILVGSKAPLAFDLEELDRRWQMEPRAQDLARLGMMGSEYLLATLYLGPDGVRKIAEGGRINTDSNMYVEFRGARDMEGSVEEAMAETFAVLEHFETPLEAVVSDPQTLLASRTRLDALVAGLRLVERDPSRFEKMARSLPAAPR